MDENRQTNLERVLPLSAGVKPWGNKGAVGSSVAEQRSESLMFPTKLMEEVIRAENVKKALERVESNAGSPGVDGMKAEKLHEYLRKHWSRIRKELLEGTYKPQPVRRVEIPKPDGSGMRMLGIPTVLDRFIQQSMLQVLQEGWDRTFSEHSYGFRPKRSAHQAVAKAQGYLREGYGYVVDIDLEKFFGAPGKAWCFQRVKFPSPVKFEREIDQRVERICAELKAGRYKAPPVRRIEIPKGEGKTRPLGIPTVEDRVLQRAVARIISAIYEQDFLDCSYGFRPGRNPHQA